MIHKDVWKILAVGTAMLILAVTLQRTAAENRNAGLSQGAEERWTEPEGETDSGKQLIWRVNRIITENWILLSIGLILTAVFVRLAYCERGYIAAGSEWFIFPLILFVKIFIRSGTGSIKKIRQKIKEEMSIWRR